MNALSDIVQQMLAKGESIGNAELQEMLLQSLAGGGAPTPGDDQPGMADLQNWRAEAERSEQTIDALIGKLEMLACAVGACPSCWGTDGPCPACGGNGKGAPGNFLPDPDCFETYVTPVLRALAQHRAGEGLKPRQGRVRRPRHPPPEPRVQDVQFLEEITDHE